MKKLLLTSLLLSLSITGCSCSRHGSGDNKDPWDDDDEPEIVPGMPVTVRFYTDYNHTESADILLEYVSANGELLTQKPANPTTSYYEEFTVFKGWSEKPIIDDDKDLWDFSTDVVASHTGVLRIFGIWVATGE